MVLFSCNWKLVFIINFVVSPHQCGLAVKFPSVKSSVICAFMDIDNKVLRIVSRSIFCVMLFSNILQAMLDFLLWIVSDAMLFVFILLIIYLPLFCFNLFLVFLFSSSFSNFFYALHTVQPLF